MDLITLKNTFAIQAMVLASSASGKIILVKQMLKACIENTKALASELLRNIVENISVNTAYIIKVQFSVIFGFIAT